MIANGYAAEILTRKKKLGDLATPVRQVFAQPNHAADNFVCVVYRLSLTEDRLVLSEMDLATKAVQGPKLFVCDGG